jgi:hypothetical protein
MAVWYSLYVVIWYIFPVLVCLDQEKSGNPLVANPRETSGNRYFNLALLGQIILGKWQKNSQWFLF